MGERLPRIRMAAVQAAPVFLDRDATVEEEHVHRKLTPTVGERLVHAPGLPVGLRVLDTELGRLSGLICGENSNPLAVFVLLSQHTMVHVASWPNLPGRGMLARSERALLAGRAFAFTAKAFVVNACGAVDDRMREMLAYTEDDRTFLARRELSGGSSVVGPSDGREETPAGWEAGDIQEVTERRLT